MAHGRTLEMRKIRRPEPRWVVRPGLTRPGFFGDVVMSTYVNPDKDRSLHGKARRRARREAAREAR